VKSPLFVRGAASGRDSGFVQVGFEAIAVNLLQTRFLDNAARAISLTPVNAA
jgi:hypothetical protein